MNQTPPQLAPEQQKSPTTPDPSPNGGPGRLASEGAPDDTADPKDSGGKKAPAPAPLKDPHGDRR